MLFLPPEERFRLKAPFGTLFSDIDSALKYASGCRIYSVGDVVTASLLDAGVIPDLSIIDGVTLRGVHVDAECVRAEKARVTNPAGYISDELIAAVKMGLMHPPFQIFVEGEEDLAVIPLVMELADDSALFYGQPDEGVVVNIINEHERACAREIMGKFVSIDVSDDF